MPLSRKAVAWMLLAVVGLYALALWAGYALGRGPAVAPVITLTVANLSGERVDRVVIRHGGARLQEEIVLLQLGAGERRQVGVNSDVGSGFNVEVYRPGREMSSVCVGKGAATAWHRLDLLPNNLRFGDGP